MVTVLKVMVGSMKGAVSRIKMVAKSCSTSHSILHRHALVCQKIAQNLDNVLKDAIQIINFVKTRPIRTRLFKIVCDDMGSEHKSLLMHTAVRWLSWG